MKRVGGTPKVVDRSTGKLVTCNSSICPFSDGGVNYGPEAVGGYWSGGINGWVADEKRREATYQFLSFMGSPPQCYWNIQSGNGLEMSRISEIDAGN